MSPAAIRKARVAAGLSAAALARLLGVAESTVRRWEAGGRTPSDDTVRRIARALGVGVEVLR